MIAALLVLAGGLLVGFVIGVATTLERVPPATWLIKRDPAPNASRCPVCGRVGGMERE